MTDTIEIVRKRKSTVVTNAPIKKQVIEVGDVGKPGPATTLTVGEVSVSADIVEPVITITGVSPAQTINFTFPAGSAAYRHVQSAPSTTWTIQHNMGFYPGGVTVIDSGGSYCLGNLSYPNINTVVVEFSSAFNGVAYLS